MSDIQAPNQTRRYMLGTALVSGISWPAGAMQVAPDPAQASGAGSNEASMPRNFVTPEQFGAHGAGADDTVALQKAVATGRHVYITGTYSY